MATSRDIARAAGVSQTTVSRVLQGGSYVSVAARERVMTAMVEMNYRPNALARAMRTSRTGTIGVIVTRITNPFYPQLLDLLSRQLATTGHRTVVWDAESGGEDAAIEAMRDGLVDGVLHAAATDASVALRRALVQGAPMVLVNRSVDGAACDQVVSDNTFGGAQVAEYLVRNGRRRIGLISGPQQISTFRDRERGFLQRLRESRRMPLRKHIQRVEKSSYHTGHEAMTKLLTSTTLPDAVFCGNDALAFGALDAARRLAVKVPQDLWVVGYDDVDMASWGAFELTTVRQPLVEMSHLAVDLLLARLNKQAAQSASVHCLESKLVIRQSTAQTRF